MDRLHDGGHGFAVRVAIDRIDGRMRFLQIREAGGLHAQRVRQTASDDVGKERAEHVGRLRDDAFTIHDRACKIRCDPRTGGAHLVSRRITQVARFLVQQTRHDRLLLKAMHRLSDRHVAPLFPVPHERSISQLH
ncbi:hypothetical protein [Paraburkholderia atlantica]|uniref:hypothetical protein n=1 Tax=Paraburkholderia atlantica TaxID=2654982 RepID=UPI003D1941B2